MLIHVLTLALLTLPTVALAGGFIGVMIFIRAWRRAWGAHRQNTGAMVLASLAFLLIHAGYLASPVLFHLNLATLALWLTVPVAMLVTLLLTGVLVIKGFPGGALSPRAGMHKAMILFALLALYLLTPITLMIAR
jgi:multisubunit Na+/H+ antiporter MnhG subunit